MRSMPAPGGGGEDRAFLNYRQLADRLAPYVREHGLQRRGAAAGDGISPGRLLGLSGAWAISPHQPLAAHDFMYLVDRLHRAGLAVILDWVPPLLQGRPRPHRLDGTSLYEYADPLKREHRGLGPRVFDFGRDDVRSLPAVLRPLVDGGIPWTACGWMLVASMLYLDYGRRTGVAAQRPRGHENLEAIRFCRDLNRLAAHGSPALTAAEESTAWPKVTWPIADGGLGFDLKWNMGWMNDVCHYPENGPLVPAVPPQGRNVFHDVRLLRAVCAAPVPRRGGLYEGLPPGQNARGRLAAAGRGPGFTAYAGPSRQKLTFMGAELGQWQGVGLPGPAGLVPAGQ